MGVQRADVNMDGAVTVDDVFEQAAQVTWAESGQLWMASADVDGDGAATLTDLCEVVDVVLAEN